MILLLFFSFGQLDLTRMVLLKKRFSHTVLPQTFKWPAVVIQLPVYNEKFVITRLLDEVRKMDYPADLLKVQILDDSTDETSQIIDQWMQDNGNDGFEFQVFRRSNRTGFKAGALADGLTHCGAEFIAIFDADFLPPSDFLKRTLPRFSDHQVGVVQTRWGHLNAGHNLMTRLQELGLNAHFTIEQVGRMELDGFLNFNGTAGVWRKACIQDAGGWSSDTLTEDFDLSYRAQLRGWKIVFDGSIICPAELPETISGVIAQHGRWNKGGAETARKLFRKVINCKISWRKKYHAICHLGSSSIFPLLLAGSISSALLVFIPVDNEIWKFVFRLGIISFIGFLAIFFFYLISAVSHWYSVIKFFPPFLLLNMGLSFRHSISVVEGWFGKRSSFNRTPKFAGLPSTDYQTKSLTLSGLPEILCGAFFLTAVYTGILNGISSFILIHGLMSIGFFWIALLIILKR